VFLSNGLIVPPPLFCWRGCNFTAFAYTQHREREGRKEGKGGRDQMWMRWKGFQPIRDKGGEREPGRAGVAADLTVVDPWKHSQQQKLFLKKKQQQQQQHPKSWHPLSSSNPVDDSRIYFGRGENIRKLFTHTKQKNKKFHAIINFVYSPPLHTPLPLRNFYSTKQNKNFHLIFFFKIITR
jgi:hypothetical protein